MILQEEEIPQLKEEGRADYLFRRMKVETFMNEMIENQYVSMSLRDEQDRKVLAEYMYEKQFRSFDEYQFKCSEQGKSLLTEPYQFFGIQRQFIKKPQKELMVMKDKQKLLQLHEELEPMARILNNQKILRREQDKRKLLRLKQDRLNQKRKEELELLDQKYKQIEQQQKRQAAINKHKKELKSLLQMNLEKNVKSEYDENQENKEKKLNSKYQIFDNKPIINQQILLQPFNVQGLKACKQEVFKMIQEAYDEARNNILSLIEEKRQNTRQIAQRQREARRLIKLMREKENEKKKQLEDREREQNKDIEEQVKNNLEYSDDSDESIIIVDGLIMENSQIRPDKDLNEGDNENIDKTTSRSFFSSSSGSEEFGGRLRRNRDIEDD